MPHFKELPSQFGSAKGSLNWPDHIISGNVFMCCVKTRKCYGIIFNGILPNRAFEKNYCMN